METTHLGYNERFSIMTNQPTFRAPSTPTEQPVGSRADIIQVDKALQSMRDSGFDLTAAAGEPIDNSIEAGGSLIRVITGYGDRRRAIEKIAFADNGTGIDPSILAHILSMGYSTRYGQRTSLGRFGVGMKLAGLSLGRRIDVYAKQVGDPAIWHAYFDLEEITSGRQKQIIAERVVNWPAEYEDAMVSPDGEPFESGALVIYGKIDRLTSGGHYGTSLDQKIHDLRTFIARVYRKFLDQGLVIELNGTKVTLLDPLFLMDNPRIIERYRPDDPRGTIIDEADIDIAEGHSIHVTVTIVPVQFRWKEGDGGLKDHLGKDIREFQIADSAGKISMVRNGREINYDQVARLLPAGVDKVDRYIGIEVTFPAVLDEFFQVRNVKRGAVPVDKLRDQLRTWLDRPVRAARKEIRRHWGEVVIQEQVQKGEHQDAADAAARAEQTAPKGQAGRELTEDQTEQLISELLHDLGVQDDTEKASKLRKQIEDKPMILVDGNWPGKEIFEITHLNGKAIVRLNHRHPFIRDVYDPLKAVGNGGELSSEDLVELVRKSKRGLDVLFLAYAKGENMHRKPEIFDDLRSYWGQFTQSYLRELPGEE
jgi:hypothetical protein